MDTTSIQKPGVKEEIERLEKLKQGIAGSIPTIQSAKDKKFVDNDKIDNRVTGLKEQIKQIDEQITRLKGGGKVGTEAKQPGIASGIEKKADTHPTE
jgi:hypothetical protein